MHNNRQNELMECMIGLQVQRGESQFGIGHLLLEETRYRVVDYLSAIYSFNFCFISGVPRPIPPALNVLRPFEAAV